MTVKEHKDVQSAFLNHLRKTRMGVTVFLTNGVKLQGKVTWFDNFSLTLLRDNVTQLVYKHAIATVMPEENLQLHDIKEFDNAGNADFFCCYYSMIITVMGTGVCNFKG